MRARRYSLLATLAAATLAASIAQVAPSSAGAATRQPLPAAFGGHDDAAAGLRSTSASPRSEALRATSRRAARDRAVAGAASVSSARYGATEIGAVAATLRSLVHGPEISSLDVYVAAPAELHATCGAIVVACYLPGERRMVVSGVDRPVAGVSREFAIAHEYGHHVANSQEVGDGLPAAGTARWATYERVCQLTRRGQIVPEAGPAHYWDDPEEAFADAYARLNAPRAALSWQYSSLLRPTLAALAKIHADVTRPYAGPATDAWSGSLWAPPPATAAEAAASSGAAGVKVGSARAVADRPWVASRVVRTPLDGRVAVSVRATPGAPLGATLRDPATNRVLARAATAPDGTAHLSLANCGRDALRLEVRATDAPTPFEATITRP